MVHPRERLRNFSVFLLLLFLLPLHAESDYTLGEGAQIGTLPMYVGGYFSLDYRNRDDEQRYRVDDIASLSYGGNEKLSYLVEVEFKEFYVENHNANGTEIQRGHHLYVERLYFDYNINENYTFRGGKYNSPIGFWNLLPINVLRETTSSPISSYIIFPKFTTGADLTYSSFKEGELKIDLMLQNGRAIDNGYNNYAIDRHYGFGISYEKGDYTVKANGGYFRKVDAQERDLYYALVSAKYEADNYQLQGEIGSQRSSDDATTTYAGYLQGAYRFNERHIGIVRVESFMDDLNGEDGDIAVVGYTYRPLYPVAIKSEYQWHSQTSENQLLFSLSVLF